MDDPESPAGGERGHGLSRRDWLRLTGAAGIGVTLWPEAAPARADGGSAPADSVSFYGQHQAGIVTPQQAHLITAAFDVTVHTRAELRDLLRHWSATAARLTAGKPMGSRNSRQEAPTQDTGEATGLRPCNLTVTFGFGPGLFEHGGRDRFGLRRHRPAALAPIPAFRGERLDPARSGGDLCLQVCGDDAQVVFHALHNLRRLAHGAAMLRWLQEGFIPGADANPDGGTPRNLMGFRDGTNNLRRTDSALMDRYVWAGNADHPDWMRGGSYMVTRRITMNLDRWDGEQLHEQEATFGRHKGSGAPFGAADEFAPIDLTARVTSGKPLIPRDAHVRLAHQGPERILRRGYSFCDGYDHASGELEAGLFFISFQRDPRTQFVPLQRRLAAHDALNEYITHTAGALFACPPGTSQGGYMGETLLGL